MSTQREYHRLEREVASVIASLTEVIVIVEAFDLPDLARELRETAMPLTDLLRVAQDSTRQSVVDRSQ